MLLPELFRDDVLRLETPRLWLRWPRAADARALHRFASRIEVAGKTATWPHPLPEDEADRRIMKARDWNSEGRALVLAIVRKKEPDRLVGLSGLHPEREEERSLGLGFMLDPELHNRGIMTEAVGRLIDTVLATAPVARVRGSCLIGNAASQRVFEKVGFELAGESWKAAPARGGQLEACLDFELTRAAWRSATAARRADGRHAGPEVRAA